MLLSLSTFLNIAAQKINFQLPEGYENEISKKEYKYLVNESVKVISKYYSIASIKSGVITLKPDQDYSILNLHNLIVQCAKVDKKDWETLIHTHFKSMYESMEKQKQLDPNKFETLVDYLSIRIYEESFIRYNGGSDNLIVKEDVEGTYSVLMLDLPSTFTPIQKEMFGIWNKTTAEVFGIAQKNVNKQQFIKATETIEVKGEEITVHFIENEDYGASLALDLKTNAPEFVGELGAVVAIPNKGIVNLCKISKEKPLDFVLFIQKFKPIVEQFNAQHTQPVSTNFYWYYKGTFTKINLTEENGIINVVAPVGLTELMSEKK